MTITDILAEIDEKYPNGLTPDSKARKADMIHKRICRKLKKQNFVSYALLADQAEYPLSIDPSDIIQVDVKNSSDSNYNTYPLRKVTDNVDSNYYYIISDQGVGDWIGIYPTPTLNADMVTLNVDTLTIYYYDTPATLTVGGASPLLNEKYHMMIVYGVCKEIAENYRDTDNAFGFVSQYNTLETELLGYLQDPITIKLQDERRWW